MVVSALDCEWLPTRTGWQHCDVEPSSTGDLTDHKRLGERGRRSRLHVAGRVISLRHDGTGGVEAEAERLLSPERNEQHDVDVVDLVALDTGRSGLSSVGQP